MEIFLSRQLRKAGKLLIADNRLTVGHVQPHGFWGTVAAHVHNGRSISGFRLEFLGRRWHPSDFHRPSSAVSSVGYLPGPDKQIANL
jgi:hypothetical protein